jgi:ubiquinone/menaquinone biosynthesis C-methylase UbiE
MTPPSDALPPEALRAGYDRSAPGYDARFAELQRPKHDAVLARARVAAGERVLDVGCGTGLLAARLEGARVTGVDLSIGMLERARSKLAPVQGDALALPFRERAFDVAFAVTSLLVGHRSLTRALVELGRVLVPGGRLAVTLLREDVPRGFERELRACGLSPGEAFECGQDVGWIAVKRSS